MKKLTFIIPLLFLFSCNESFNEEPLYNAFIVLDESYRLKEELKEYNALSDDKRTDLLFDDFSTNANNWNEGQNDNTILRLKNGEYHLGVYSSENSYYFKTAVDFNGSSNYELEIEFKISDGSNAYGCGLIWAANSTYDNYCFAYFLKDKTTRIGEFGNSSYNYWFDRVTAIENYSDVSFHLLTIRQVEKVVYVFLDKALICYTEEYAAHGNNIAFRVSARTNLVIDHFRYSQIMLD